MYSLTYIRKLRNLNEIYNGKVDTTWLINDDVKVYQSSNWYIN